MSVGYDEISTDEVDEIVAALRADTSLSDEPLSPRSGPAPAPSAEGPAPDTADTAPDVSRETSGEDYQADPDPDYGTTTFAEGLDAPRVTAAIRRDIKAKIAMFLAGPAAVLAGRDPVCGMAWLNGIKDSTVYDPHTGEKSTSPGIASCLADIACDSPEVVAWFTKAGGWTKWFSLAAALQVPVATIIGHHITHSIPSQGHDPEAEESWEMYATRR